MTVPPPAPRPFTIEEVLAIKPIAWRRSFAETPGIRKREDRSSRSMMVRMVGDTGFEPVTSRM